MQYREARNAARDGSKARIAKGEDRGHRGTVARLFTSKGKFWVQIDSRTKIRYAQIEYVELFNGV